MAYECGSEYAYGSKKRSFHYRERKYRERKDGEVVYVSDPDYSVTGEDDMTVMPGSES